MDLFNKYVIIFLISLLLLLLALGIIWFHNQRLECFMALLSPTEKIGQLLMISPASTEFDDELKNFIKNYHIGNIKIFGKNYQSPKQLHKLIVSAQNTALHYNKGIPMFIATDQEGGWIMHLKKGFTIPPSNMAIGKTREIRYAYIAGKIIASELSAVGVNVNFAPVVDLYLNSQNWVIGPRAYSSDPQLVTVMANEFIKSHIKFNVLPVIKHYPGQGRVSGDSHIEVLTNSAKYEVVINNEVYPFRKLCKCDMCGIMTAHIAVPTIVKYIESREHKDYKQYYYLPATLSEILIKKYLLEYNNAKSLIFSDEISMKGITAQFNLEEAAYRAIKSGVNIVVIDKDYPKIKKIVKYLEKKYYTDKQFKKDVENSIKKIIETKTLLFSNLNKMKIFSGGIFHIPKFKINTNRLNIINSEKHKSIAYSLSIVTTDIIRNRKNLIPLTKFKQFKDLSFTIVSSTPILFNAVRKYSIKAKFIPLKKLTLKNISNRQNCMIIFGLKDKKETDIVKKIYKKNKNIIVINFLHPHNIENLNYIDTIICTYSDNFTQISASIDVLFNGKRTIKKIFFEYLSF